VECGFVWQCGERAYSDFVSGRKALNVPVQLVKWGARDIQCTERRVEVKAGCRWDVSLFSFGFARVQTNTHEIGRRGGFVLLSSRPLRYRFAWLF